ncbi:hypothetical protein [Dyadobacter sp. 676]|uniref:Collagen-like protein n=1 Tax=Dyadobacter sp. 676 TaxID=3088362 RepID=A0AAU8FCY4_9BACT
MLKKLLLFASVALMIALVSCEGKQGDVGPAGAQGPAGPAGPAGKDGIDGAMPMIISTGVDTTDEEGGIVVGIPNLNPQEDSLLRSSVVLVYLKAQGVYWPMPGLISFGGGKVSSFTFVHGVEDATFVMQLLPTDWNEQQETPPTRIFEDVRVVILPGSVVEANGRLSAEIFKDYNKTIAALGLTDANVKAATKVKLRLKN